LAVSTFLVNNAGVIEVGPVESFAVEDFEEAMKTIFWGTVYATLGGFQPSARRRSAAARDS
jgi:NAD(P)-dependent dehydrogenase (short-subunit alcohol dehydrogenase family)